MRSPVFTMRWMATALEVDNLMKEYRGGTQPVRALAGVSLELAAGEFVAVLGASGSGKSTLLHLIAGLDEPTSGRVIIEGKDIFALSDQKRTIFRRRRLGVVFQAYNLLPGLTAWENVALPAYLDGRNGTRAQQRARTLLERVHLADRMDHRPQALSGGEQQRVALARALMNEPTLLLADEPTGNLDTRHGQEIWRLLAELVAPEKHEGSTEDGIPIPAVIAVTHDAAGAACAHRVVVLRDGGVVGEFDPRAESGSAGEHNAALVAARYAQLAD